MRLVYSYINIFFAHVSVPPPDSYNSLRSKPIILTWCIVVFAKKFEPCNKDSCFLLWYFHIPFHSAHVFLLLLLAFVSLCYNPHLILLKTCHEKLDNVSSTNNWACLLSLLPQEWIIDESTKVERHSVPILMWVMTASAQTVRLLKWSLYIFCHKHFPLLVLHFRFNLL